MSYEAWGDDDDGRDGYREQLLEAGWLTAEDAAELRKELEQERAKRKAADETIEALRADLASTGPEMMAAATRNMDTLAKLQAAERVVAACRPVAKWDDPEVRMRPWFPELHEALAAYDGDGSRAGGTGGKE